MKQQIIDSVLSSMGYFLDDDQMKKLKDSVHSALSQVSVIKNKTDLKNAENMKRAQFCINRKIPVKYKSGTYIPEALTLRFIKNVRHYSVELKDTKAFSSTISVGLNDIEWPTEGGGYICSQ